MFAAELDVDSKIETIVDNFRRRISSDNLAEGIIIERAKFTDFSKYQIHRQIEKLQTQYKDFKEYRLSDVSTKITPGKYNELFQDVKNAIYIPKIGSSKVVSNVNLTKMKHQNYFQVELDDSIVINEYAAEFYSSALGKLILESLAVGGTIPHLNKQSLVNSTIAIPGISEQKSITDANRKLISLEVSINQFKTELSLNPKSARAIQDKLDSILIDLNTLSKADQVLSLIRNGESKTLEFKQTLSLDIKDKEKKPYIEYSVLKTIAAFLNSLGGILLIGVDDEGSIIGLREEIEKFYQGSEDNFLKKFKNLIKEKVGEEFYPFVNYDFVHFEDLAILYVNVMPAIEPFYLDEKEFFVRTNPATDKLEGKKILEYIKGHRNLKGYKDVL